MNIVGFGGDLQINDPQGAPLDLSSAAAAAVTAYDKQTVTQSAAPWILGALAVVVILGAAR